MSTPAETSIPQSKSDDTDDDYELKLAKEMAMAIAKNPNLTPAELKELQNKKSQEQQQQQQQVKKQEQEDVFRKTTDKTKSIGQTIKMSLSSGGDSTKSSPKNAELKTASSMPPLDTQASTDSSDDDDDLPLDDAARGKQNEIRLTGIVWKRRSGLGKYSSTAAWERRRIVLKGNRLAYYTNLKLNSGEEDDTSIESAEPSPMAATSQANSRPSMGGNWLENAMKQAQEGVANLAAGNANAAASGDDGGGARGYLDLVKENASVSASLGHSGAPTPFALSVKILTQTKWKFCFDTQAELMQWLAVLTDVVVQASVDSYNAAIVQSSDPKHAGETHGQLSEPPLRASEKKRQTVGGHRLWATGHYKIKSANFPDFLDNVSEGELDDYKEDMDDDENLYKPPTTNPMSLMLEPTSGIPVYCVPQDYLVPLGILVNMAILLSRASATSVDAFWYILAFVNMAMFVFVKPDRIQMEVKKPVITAKMARRLSSVMGMKILPTVVESKDKKAKKKKNKMDKKESSVSTSVAKDYKPLAGTSAMRIESIDQPAVDDIGHVFCGWMPGKSTEVQVRSHGYKSTKVKVGSPGELYECTNMDIFDGTKRYPDIAKRVTLPDVSYPDDPTTKTWNAPDRFIVSVSFPTDPPKLYGAAEDGGGFTVCMYYTMRQETRDILKRITADGYDPKSEPTPDDIQKSKVNAVRLFEEWCRLAPTDNAWMARMKVVPLGHNFEEIGLPGWISAYNGKPFLIKRPGQTGFLFRHPEQSCMEFDINLYPFPYIAKQGICFIKDSYMQKVVASFGFVIEGRSDDELPECLIGLTTLCYPDPEHMIKAADFFAGTYPKSYELKAAEGDAGKAEEGADKK